jgi:type I restriction enzyme, S subunit
MTMAEVDMQTDFAADVSDGYKLTEIGVLPEDWKVLPLGKVCELRSKTVKPEDSQHLPYVGLEHIDSGDFVLRRHGHASEVKSNKSLFFPGDVLYGKLRPYLDKAVLADRDGICSTDVLVLAPTENIIPDFLAQIVHTRPFINHAVATTTGANHPRTSWSSIRECSIPVPPLLHEQRSIASVLRAVQQAKEATEQVIASARELKRSMMDHLFTYGPIPVEDADQVPLKETEVGPVPEHWDVIELGGIVGDGPQNGLYKPASEYGTGVPILRIDAFGSGEEIKEQRLKRLRLSEPETKKYELREGDIVVNRVNGSVDILGKSAIVGHLAESTVFESNMMKFSVDVERTSGWFLLRFLNSRAARRQIIKKARIIHQASINQQDLKSIVVPLPPLEEQKEIVHLLKAIDEKITTEENRKRTLDILFKTLLHDLMTGKVRLNNVDFTEITETV